MKFPIKKVSAGALPERLFEVADPPEQSGLRVRGTLPSPHATFLAVVGSRKYTQYGKDMCESVIAELAGSGVVIVSGLALGIDAIAHKAALDAGLDCVAIPGSGLSKDVLAPKTNHPLAGRILTSGGALLSEFADDREAAPWTFPQRNRIMAGLSHAVLVVEAAKKSGTLITARLASEYNRDVFTIPGSLKSKNTAGPHRLIRDGAALIRSGDDILKELGLEDLGETTETKSKNLDLSENQQAIYDALSEPKTKDELLAAVNLPASKVNILLSKMELSGIIQESGGKVEVKA